MWHRVPALTSSLERPFNEQVFQNWTYISLNEDTETITHLFFSSVWEYFFGITVKTVWKEKKCRRSSLLNTFFNILFSLVRDRSPSSWSSQPHHLTPVLRSLTLGTQWSTNTKKQMSVGINSAGCCVCVRVCVQLSSLTQSSVSLLCPSGKNLLYLPFDSVLACTCTSEY